MENAKSYREEMTALPIRICYDVMLIEIKVGLFEKATLSPKMNLLYPRLEIPCAFVLISLNIMYKCNAKN